MEEKKSTTLVIGIIVVVVLIIVGIGIAIAANKSNTKKTVSTKITTSTADTATVNNAILKTKVDSHTGDYLATPTGSPLYTYSGDSASKSNCTGSCLAAWPAYTTGSSSTTSLPTNVSFIVRSDNGLKQYTYKGLPLYTFVSDTANGQPTGNGSGGFYLARP